MTKFVTAVEAVKTVRDNANVAVSGFCGFCSADEIFKALRQQYAATATPKNITLLKGVSIGDGKSCGVNCLGMEGMIGRIISSHIGLEPALSKLVVDDKCLAYMIPLGTVTELLRSAAAKRPGVLTTSGLHTFVDPRIDGGKANSLTKEKGPDIVSLEHLGGQDCLFYPAIPIDVAIIRGTYADEDGNISLEKEAVAADQFEAAAAAHSSGGIVLVQVEGIVKKGTLNLNTVKLHNFMVDYVVVAKPENHIQCYSFDGFHPEWTGAIRIPVDTMAPMKLDDRKVCGRRAAMELHRNDLINLGLGMPDSVAAVAAEEGLTDAFTLSIESGVLGGIPLQGLGLGGAVNPEAIYKTADILDIYNGGGLNMSVLGLAEVDEEGNVNVSKFGTKVTGPGGFIDISQKTPTVIFVGTFMAKGLETEYVNGGLHIRQEGRAAKFKKTVTQVTFSGAYAKKTGQRVMIITERAVFKLTDKGWLLTEIAPGMDLEKDILAHMEFHPLIANNVTVMDRRIFMDEPMGLKI
jgi:propionate CoA-transferase